MSTTGDVLDSRAAGRLPALHPRRRRVRRRALGHGHRVRLAVVRPARRRLLQAPSADPGCDASTCATGASSPRSACPPCGTGATSGTTSARRRRPTRRSCSRSTRSRTQGGTMGDVHPLSWYHTLRRRARVLHGAGPHGGELLRSALPRASPRRNPLGDRRAERCRSPSGWWARDGSARAWRSPCCTPASRVSCCSPTCATRWPRARRWISRTAPPFYTTAAVRAVDVGDMLDTDARGHRGGTRGQARRIAPRPAARQRRHAARARRTAARAIAGSSSS